MPDFIRRFLQLKAGLVGCDVYYDAALAAHFYLLLNQYQTAAHFDISEAFLNGEKLDID